MNAPRHPEHAVEPAGTPTGSAAGPSHLRLVHDADAADDGSRVFARVSGHIGVAEELGVEPLTVTERARSMLDAACEGWRTDRRCVDQLGVPLHDPHPRCLRAQYHHDVLLLEHGLLIGERTDDEQ